MKSRRGRRIRKGNWAYAKWLTRYFLKRTCKWNRNYVRDLDIYG